MTTPTTISVPGWIMVSKGYDQETRSLAWNEFTFFHSWESGKPPEGLTSYQPVCRHTLTFELPAGWNPIAGEIALTELEVALARREFEERIGKLTERLESLRALSYDQGRAS